MTAARRVRADANEGTRVDQWPEDSLRLGPAEAARAARTVAARGLGEDETADLLAMLGLVLDCSCGGRVPAAVPRCAACGAHWRVHPWRGLERAS